MKNKRKIPAIVKSSFFTMVTVIVWITFEVVKIFMTKPPPSVSAEILSPIDPALDETTLNKLQQRVYISENEIGNIKIATATAQPTSTNQPASASASVAQSATASPSAVATTGATLR